MATVTVPSVALPNPGDDMDAEQVRDWITNVISFLEGTNTDEANVDTSGTDGIVGKSVAQTITGLKTWESTSAGGGGVREVIKLGLNPSSGTPANSDGARITVYADDAGGTAGDRAYLDILMEAATAGAVNAYVRISTDVADTVTAGFAVGKLDTYLDVYAPARTHTAATNTYVAYIRPGGAQTIPAGTTGLVAGLRVDEPNITATGTVTNAATVYVANAPTEGGTGNYALWVDDGSVKFDGTFTVDGLATHGGNVVSDTDSTDSLGTTSVRWANLYVDNLGDSGQDLAVGATVLSFAGSSTIDTSANTLTLSGTLTTSGTTWTNLGAVTTVDINGGTVDGVIIGGASAAAGTFTVVTATDVDATAGTISSNATTFSFDAGATIDTSGNNALTLNAGTAALTITAGDATLYDATNNADTSLSIGTSATERVLIQALNGAANQSLESLNIVTQTAAVGANAGQITLGVDDATILTIDDGGINAILGATTAAAATVTTLQANTGIVPDADDGAYLGTTALGFSDLFLAAGGVVNWANGQITVTETDENTLTIAGVATRLDLAAGILEMNNAVEWDTGVAVVAAEYSIGRDADATNQLHLNVPTGAGMELSVNDVAILALTASAVNIATATNWQLGGVAFTGSMANLNTLRDDSMADALHRHSELSASDGTPNPALQVDAAGNVGIGVVPQGTASGYTALSLGGNGYSLSTTAVGASGLISWTHNANYDTDGSWEYISTDEASMYQQTNGAHALYVAASGTAGNDITWTQAMTLTNAGQLLVGHTASVAVATVQELIQAIGTGQESGISAARFSADNGGPYLLFGKSRSATKGTMTAVVDNDVLGSIFATGADGTDFVNAGAAIFFRVNGAPAADDIPGEIELATYDGGAQTGSLILDAAGDLTLKTTGISTTAFMLTTDAGQATQVQWQEGAADRYWLRYDGSSNYLSLGTFDSDGAGTDADVIRIPDGQLTVDGNTTFDANAFDWVCADCGWHGPDLVTTCPKCDSLTVSWHDDVALMDLAIHGDLRCNPVVVARLERIGVVNTYGGDDLFISMNRSPWFLMSGLVQTRHTLDSALERIEELESQVTALLQTA